MVKGSKLKLIKLQVFHNNGYIKHDNRNSTYIDLHYDKRPNEGLSCVRVQIHVNRLVFPRSKCMDISLLIGNYGCDSPFQSL